MKTRLLLVVIAALSLPVLFCAAVAARDSHAPAGAGDRWLPCENWAMFHWLPFNERRLYALGGFKRAQFKAWIRDDDHHTLAGFIERHGKDPDMIVEQLMEPWTGKVSVEQFNELKRRTGEVMTQGHLSQHVMFHYFHNPAIALNSKYIFGVRSPDFMAARHHGYSPRQIAKAGRHSGRTVIRRAFKVLRRYANAGVRGDHTTRKQSSSFMGQQRGWLNRWWHQKIGRRGDMKKFPRGHRAHTNDRHTVTCGYFVGSNHVKGEHEPGHHH